MIVSVSRRSDIPAFYSEWFFNRLKAGFVHVPNPCNSRSLREVPLNKEAVDCFVFWSKNPAPMLSRLAELRDYAFYFQFTLNPYGIDIEPGFRDKKSLLETFEALSECIGAERIVWRYDPILVSSEYSIDWHLRHFADYCKRLEKRARSVVISFYDEYRCSIKKCRALGLQPISDEIMKTIAGGFSEIAASYGLQIETCAESIDLSQFNIGHGRCIDDRIISKIVDHPFVARPDQHQRPGCGCAASIDIGIYSTCPAACRYCYANKGDRRVAANVLRHDCESSLLTGRLDE